MSARNQSIQADDGRQHLLSQVPQMLLEEAWGAGRGARIMCTQPRRISAVSVAERIAQERGEQIGDNIGYTIRLDTKCGAALHPQQLEDLKQPPAGIAPFCR